MQHIHINPRCVLRACIGFVLVVMTGPAFAADIDWPSVRPLATQTHELTLVRLTGADRCTAVVDYRASLRNNVLVVRSHYLDANTGQAVRRVDGEGGDVIRYDGEIEIQKFVVGDSETRKWRLEMTVPHRYHMRNQPPPHSSFRLYGESCTGIAGIDEDAEPAERITWAFVPPEDWLPRLDPALEEIRRHAPAEPADGEAPAPGVDDWFTDELRGRWLADENPFLFLLALNHRLADEDGFVDAIPGLFSEDDPQRLSIIVYRVFSRTDMAFEDDQVCAALLARIKEFRSIPELEGLVVGHNQSSHEYRGQRHAEVRRPIFEAVQERRREIDAERPSEVLDRVDHWLIPKEPDPDFVD